MRLYHFTSSQYIDGCLSDGLTKGRILQRWNPPKFKRGYQWLTVNPDWNQPWANRSGLLPYSTTECRITIEIPQEAERWIFRWLDCCHKLTTRRIVRTLNHGGDPENWYLYLGTVKPQWFVAVNTYAVLEDESATPP